MAGKGVNPIALVLGSARGSRAAFGVAPKQSFFVHRDMPCVERHRKVCDREDALATTRAACASQNT
jgi:hypothetical protein